MLHHSPQPIRNLDPSAPSTHPRPRPIRTLTLQVLVSCSYDDTVKVWEDDGGEWYCSATLTGHASTVWSAAFSPSGRRLGTVHACTDDRLNTSQKLTRKQPARPSVALSSFFFWWQPR